MERPGAGSGGREGAPAADQPAAAGLRARERAERRRLGGRGVHGLRAADGEVAVSSCAGVRVFGVSACGFPDFVLSEEVVCLFFDALCGVCRVGSCFWVCVVGEVVLGVCHALVGSLMRHCEESCKLVTSMGGVLLFDMPQ